MMKNSAFYARKVKRLLAGARKPPPREPMNTLGLMLLAILEENALPKQAAASLAALEQEFVDYNELRVGPIKDIVDVIGRDFPQARAKAETMTVALNAAFDRTNVLSLDNLAKKPKREIRGLLRENLRLSPYAESVVTLYGFNGHALPVDEQLLVGLKLEGYIHPDSDLDDLQGFLERLVPGKDAAGAHELLREYVTKNYKKVAVEMVKLAKARQAQAQERAKQQPSGVGPTASGPGTSPPGLGGPTAPLPPLGEDEPELEEPEEAEGPGESVAREVARLKARQAALDKEAAARKAPKSAVFPKRGEARLEPRPKTKLPAATSPAAPVASGKRQGPPVAPRAGRK